MSKCCRTLAPQWKLSDLTCYSFRCQRVLDIAYPHSSIFTRNKTGAQRGQVLAPFPAYRRPRCCKAPGLWRTLEGSHSFLQPQPHKTDLNVTFHLWLCHLQALTSAFALAGATFPTSSHTVKSALCFNTKVMNYHPRKSFLISLCYFCYPVWHRCHSPVSYLHLALNYICI